MAQGRPQKSAALDKLHGNPGKRSGSKRTLPASTGKLGLPRGLNQTVKRHCSEMARYLINSGVPIALVRPIFDRYCRHYQVYSNACKIMDQNSPEQGIDDKIFIFKQNQALKAAKENSDIMLKLEKQLESIVMKATPLSDNKKNPLEVFMEKNSGKAKIMRGRP